MKELLKKQPSTADSGSLFVETFQRSVKAHPNRVALRFLADGEDQEIALSFTALDKEARKIAARLQTVARFGDRALLCYPPGTEFVSALLGCFYAGVVAVPIYPPGNKRGQSRLYGVLRDSGARFILSVSEAQSRLELLKQDPAAKDLNIVSTDTLEDALGEEYRHVDIDSHAIAFLQYTSGSTGTPKGVMISHGNLVSNLRTIIDVGGITSLDSVLSWLPIYHDMGLIGNLLMPLYAGITATLMPPANFIVKPVRWLKALAKYRATAGSAPNFSFDLCVKKVSREEIAALDLSGMKYLVNGAEPIRMQSIERFLDLVSVTGFKREAICPSYGLAEATLIATGNRWNETPTSIQIDRAKQAEGLATTEGSGPWLEVTSCGAPCEGTQVQIVDPETGSLLPPHQVGEIWVSGPSVAGGYWNNPEATQDCFGVELPGYGEGFLRTGDLGFIHGGELYVTGRLKDMMIVNGRNLFPHDVEMLLEQNTPALRSGSSVVVGIPEDDGEKIAVLAEVERSQMKTDLSAVCEAIVNCVAKEFDASVSHVVLLKHGGLPKTTSGKLQRRLTATRWQSGELEVVLHWGKGIGVSQGSTMPNRTGLAAQSSPETNRNNSSQLQRTLDWLRQYADTRVNSRVMDERRTIPPYIVLDLGNQGLLGMIVPKELGGPGFSFQEIGVISQQLAAIDLSLAVYVGLNNALGIYPILNFANDSTKAALLPGLVSGRCLASFALTERGAGSNPQALQSIAKPVEGGWVVSGEKIWIGNAAWASVISVFAKELNSDGTTGGISAFAVDPSSRGYRNGPESITMGMRAMVQNSIEMDNVFVEKRRLLGEAGKGMIVAAATMNFARAGLANICLGAMKRCAQWMETYASSRQVSTGNLLANSVTLLRMTQTLHTIAALDVFCSRVNQRLDEKREIPEEIYLACKILAPEFLWRTVDWAMQLLGGRGYIETNFLPQYFRDARLIRIFEGPTETLQTHLGSKAMMKTDRLPQWFESPAIQSKWSAFGESVQTEWGDWKARTDKAALQAAIGQVSALTLLSLTVEEVTPQNKALLTDLAQQIDQARENAKREASRLETLYRPEQISEQVARYSGEIGNVQQSLAGEASGIDETLISRRSSLPLDRPKASAPAQPKPMAPVPSVSRSSEVGKATPPAAKAPAAPPKAEPQAPAKLETPAATVTPPGASSIEENLCKWIAKSMQISVDKVKRDAQFTSFGLDSLAAYELVCQIEETYDLTIPTNLVWDYPTVAAAAEYVDKALKRAAKQKK